MQNRFTPRKSPSTFRPPTRLSRGGAFQFNKEPEKPLTGQVQGQKAAQGEERLSRVLEAGLKKKIVSQYAFRWTTLKRGVVGFKELDFFVKKSNGEILAISVKGKDFVHFGTSQKEKDKLNEIIILNKLRDLGYNVREITTVFDNQLDTKEKSEKTGRKLGIYR